MSTNEVDDERRLQPGWCAACLVAVEKKGQTFCTACGRARRTWVRNEWARRYYWRLKDRAQPDA